MRRLIFAVAMLATMLAGCAHRPPAPKQALPTLQLSPASLGRTLSVQQRLHFAVGGQQRELDALLEVDPDELRLLVQALGQTGVRLQWDGRTLTQHRAPWLPAAVRGERVLDDLQFALWPVDAIAATLPAGWTVSERQNVRELVHGGTAWLVATQLTPQRLRLENLAEGYRLEVETTAEASP